MKRCAPLVTLMLMTALSGAPAHTLRLHLRSQQPDPQNGAAFRTVTQVGEWDARHTAAIICDMWDRHWCDGATERVGELAPAIDRTIAMLRERGALIVHCPSDTMPFYAGTAQRLRAASALAAPPPPPFVNSRPSETALPIDDSDGGCDTGPNTERQAWTRENPAIHIAPGDAVTDNGPEVYNLLKQNDITYVLVMGVHANMCVLGRPFAIRKLVQSGFKVALIRDLTDTMYNPKRKPFVSHFEGTELVVEHIEKYWCPSTLSSDITGGPRFRFSADTRR